MIKTRKDLRFYLKEDRKRSDVSAHKVVYYLRLHGKITIGNNVFVTPNAVVKKDMPDNCVAGGIRTKVIRVKSPKA